MEAPAAAKIHRYPGVRSFEDDPGERTLFRGRDAETYDLLEFVRGERLVVLFARSGIGKSSLINAGLMERLRGQGFFPMVTRVASVMNDPVDSFYAGVRAACERATDRGEIAQCEPADPSEWNRRSFWHFFKSFYIWRGEAELLTPVVIIDQCEELFTLLSAEQRRPFIDQLAGLVRGIRPEGSPEEQEDTHALDDSPPDVRVVLAIREDSMANLEEMAERIPSILKARLRLEPLNLEQAKAAIVEPAALESPEVGTPPFTWSEDALRRVLDFLRTHKREEGPETGREVEPFQLQLVCQAAEALVRDKGLTTIEYADLGGDEGLARVLTRFYQTVIDEVCDRFRRRGLRRRLRNLCEYGLITPKGRRLLSEESTIRKDYGVPADVLRELVERRLIRKERRLGDNYYELTHDTLIDPVLASRQRREARKRRWLWGVGAVAAVALLLGGGLSLKAQRALTRAENERVAAQLVGYGQEWGDRQQYALAVAFYDAARARNPTDSVTLEAARPDTEEEQRRVTARDAARAHQARDEATKAIESARSTFESLLEEKDRDALIAIHEVIESLVETGNALAARRYVDAEDVYAAARELESKGNSRLLEAALPTVAVVRDEELRLAELLARAGYAQEALRLLSAIRMGFPQDSVPTEVWYATCWYGGLFDAPDVDVSWACRMALAGSRPPYDTVSLRRVSGTRTDSLESVLDSWKAAEEGVVAEARHDLIDLYAPMTQKEAEAGLTLLMQEWMRDPTISGYLRKTHDPLCVLRVTPPDTAPLFKEGTACADADRDSIADDWSEGVPAGMGQIEDNPCSKRLRDLAHMTILDEIFVTDRIGFNLCMSNPTSDYFQGEEDWWRAAEAWMPGAPISRSTVEGDASARQSRAFVVYTAIRDPRSNEFLGVAKAVFDANLGG